jgi:hypothetical protein
MNGQLLHGLFFIFFDVTARGWRSRTQKNNVLPRDTMLSYKIINGVFGEVINEMILHLR